MISKYVKIIWIMTFLFLISACNDQYVTGVYTASNNEYSLNVNSTDLQSISGDGGAVNMKIEALNTVNWDIQNLPEWLSSPITSGSGSQQILLNAQPNESFTTGRTHIFNITTSNSDWKINVPLSATQLKKTPELTIAPSDETSWTFDSSGGAGQLKVTSNFDWLAECGEDFVSLSKKEGRDKETIMISVSPYNSVDVTENRKAFVYFKNPTDDEVLQVLTITQTPLQNAIDAKTIDIEFGNKADAKSFSLGEIQGFYTVKSDAPWLDISKNKENELNVTVSVSDNDNDDSRSSNAYIILGNTNAVKYTFTVSQKGNSIQLNPSSLSFEANGGSRNVAVVTDSEWKTENSNDWINISQNGSTCTISVTENNSFDTRSGSVRFFRLDHNGEVVGKEAVLMVEQKARSLALDNKILQFGPDASTQSLMIESDTSWKLSTTEDWISLSTTEGFGDSAVAVSVEENPESYKRAGKIILSCLDKIIEIDVLQESMFINTPSSAIEIPAKGGESIITLNSNVSWTASSSESWLKVSPASGSGAAEIVLSTTSNNSETSREAVVTISSKLEDIKINVRQNAPTLTLSSSSEDFGYSGGTCSPIIVTADDTYTITSNNSWLSVSKNSNSFTLTASRNSGDERYGSVKVALDNVPVSRTVSVYQSGAPASPPTPPTPTLSVSPSSLQFDASGGQKSVSVSASQSYTASSSSSWLTTSISGSTLTVKASSNSGSKRSGTVTVKLADGSKSTSVSVSQDGRSSGGDGGSTGTPLVTISSATATNWRINMVATVVTNGATLKEVGFVWTTSYSTSASTPTTSSYNGKVTSTLSGSQFSGTTPQITSYTYANIRAYVIDTNNKVYYSGTRLVAL